MQTESSRAEVPAGGVVEVTVGAEVRGGEPEFEMEAEEEVDEDELDLEYSYDDEDEEDVMSGYMNVDHVPWDMRKSLMHAHSLNITCSACMHMP